MNQTSIRVYLSIFGEQFDPNALTNLVGLAPTNTGIKGQAIEGKATIYKDTFWDFSPDAMDSLLLEDITNFLVNKLKGSEITIFQFMAEHSLVAKFTIVIEIVDGQAPALYFNRTFLSCIESLNAEVDIDTYVL
ncbi:DUF4279 domain-containing protein [Spirosoma sp. HMF4905]|uniref:DUF4279 domain-containing protein n=2 Tax=Spirosoma arboris TaxID=2682092 RepID=A0A7K1SRF3_9BACT|nr:DUF4279 domain-containing protein [Spirosoma arboris]